MKPIFLLPGLVLLTVDFTMAQEKQYPEPMAMQPEMTEFWTPQPRIVTPADFDQHLIPGPSDAIVLFDGTDLSAWEHRDGTSVNWDIRDGYMTVKPRSGGDIQTKQLFEDFQLHVEWAAPEVIKGESQHRGNSGVMLQGLYEVQILDSYDNETYANGQAGSIYKQYAPLVNVTQQPGKWNTYDIIYTAPRFKPDGTLQAHARVTVLHNGVLIQNNVMVLGPTEYIGIPVYKAHGAGPIILQDHGDLVSFRNIWIREL